MSDMPQTGVFSPIAEPYRGNQRLLNMAIRKHMGFFA